VAQEPENRRQRHQYREKRTIESRVVAQEPERHETETQKQIEP
jgi:hypothetical protein